MIMSDVHTQKQRSYNMSRIRSRWTKPEKIVHNHLKGNRIKHKMHPDIEGRPDIFLKESKTLVFLDGCFWHRCYKCFQEPTSNRDFWLTKIENNVKRDRKIRKELRNDGWKIIRIWEHEIRSNPNILIKKIRSGVYYD